MKDFAHLRLLKILQRLKSLLCQKLDLQSRSLLKTQLLEIDESYTNNKINIDQYKINSIALLCKNQDICWVEQFLYRETSNFLTQTEKFEICRQILN